ncbi:hypothetical protein GCM10011510_00860 [Streptococcus himalayensis]|uniref:Uncharacterized protein n=1 Tax=Streptococcus himalayensis TaxID=1888195 RepID=A0A917ED15_9STRE|nr:hypothetical protein GCM10011510_00860 [Streptococcus himalayensis]
MCKKEGENSYIVGRRNLNRYIEISEDAYEIIKSIMELENLELVKYKLFSFSTDEIENFISKLVELNFLEIFNGELITSENINKRGISFPWIRQRVLKRIFNKVTILVWVLYLSYVYLILIPQLSVSLLDYSDIFFSKSLFITTMTVTVLDFILVMLHEFSHFLSIRLLGGELGFIGIGRRFFYFVFETRIDNIWLLEKPKRILVYLSGILCDITLLSFFILVANFTKVQLFYNISKVTILLLVVGIIFEFKFYLKTDLYFVIADIIDSRNLMTDSLMFIKSYFKHKGISAASKYYSILIGLGLIIELFILVKVGIPASILAVVQTYNNFINEEWDYFLSNLVVILLTFIELLIVGIIFFKEKLSQSSNL